MKRILFFSLLLMSLAACSNAATPTEENSFSSSSGRCANGLCVRIFVEEPVLFGEPVNLIVKVTSKEDISGLEIVIASHESMNTPIQKVFFEDAGLQTLNEEYIKWMGDIPANQEIIFTRKALLPAEEGIYLFRLIVMKQPEVLVLEDSLRIYLVKGSEQVIYTGTKMPPYIGPTSEWFITPAVPIIIPSP